MRVKELKEFIVKHPVIIGCVTALLGMAMYLVSDSIAASVAAYISLTTMVLKVR